MMRGDGWGGGAWVLVFLMMALFWTIVVVAAVWLATARRQHRFGAPAGPWARGYYPAPPTGVGGPTPGGGPAPVSFPVPGGGAPTTAAGPEATPPTTAPSAGSARVILDERFARGEIDDEEYVRRRDLLAGPGAGGPDGS
ncbi:MAG: SHOCT domain-containing protein [Actinomycetia bacterium]|nr:SHOCT domain-containing protein [Actinomycetes bacterium]